MKNRQKQFVIDGEAVVLGVNGVADFKARSSALGTLGLLFESVELTGKHLLACRPAR